MLSRLDISCLSVREFSNAVTLELATKWKILSHSARKLLINDALNDRVDGAAEEPRVSGKDENMRLKTMTQWKIQGLIANSPFFRRKFTFVWSSVDNLTQYQNKTVELLDADI